MRALAAPGMRFERKVSVSGDVLTLHYDYRTLADHVTADDAQAYVEALRDAHDLLGYSVYLASPGATQITTNHPVERALLPVRSHRK